MEYYTDGYIIKYKYAKRIANIAALYTHPGNVSTFVKGIFLALLRF